MGGVSLVYRDFRVKLSMWVKQIRSLFSILTIAKSWRRTSTVPKSYQDTDTVQYNLSALQSKDYSYTHHVVSRSFIAEMNLIC